MYWDHFELVLRDALDDEVATLDVLADDQRRRLVEASQLSEELRRDDASYHAELDWWTSPFALSEGMPPSALASDTERLRVDVARQFPVRGHQDRRPGIATDWSKILVLSTPADTRADVLRCGEVLSTVLLECTMAGMATCTLTHLIESSESRDIVRDLIGGRGEPQVLIRVGITPAMEPLPAPTPRRPLDAVLEIRHTPRSARKVEPMSNEPVTILSESESWDLLGTASLGRLVTNFGGEPEIFPVNFVVQGRTVLFRTAEGTKLFSAVANRTVIFEADDHNVAEGWSVIVRGRAQLLKADADIQQADRAGLYPWVATAKPNFVRITPNDITGRRFVFGPEPDHNATVS